MSKEDGRFEKIMPKDDGKKDKEIEELKAEVAALKKELEGKIDKPKGLNEW